MNRADTVAYAGERLLRESGDSLPSELKLEIDDGVQAVRRAIEGNDVATVRGATEALERALQRAEGARQTPVGAAAGGSRGGGDTDSDGGESVDAEFREV